MYLRIVHVKLSNEISNLFLFQTKYYYYYFYFLQIQRRCTVARFSMNNVCNVTT